MLQMRAKAGFYLVIFLFCINAVYSANFETTLSNHYGNGREIYITYTIENFEGGSDVWKIYAVKCILEPDMSCSMSSNIGKTEISRVDITENTGSISVDISSFEPWFYRLCSSSSNGQDCDSDKHYLLISESQIITKTETVYLETECECPEPEKVSCIYNATLNCPDCICNCSFDDIYSKLDNIIGIVNKTTSEPVRSNSNIISMAIKKIDNFEQQPKELNYYILLPIIGTVGLVLLLRRF